MALLADEMAFKVFFLFEIMRNKFQIFEYGFRGKSIELSNHSNRQIFVYLILFQIRFN